MGSWSEIKPDGLNYTYAAIAEIAAENAEEKFKCLVMCVCVFVRVRAGERDCRKLSSYCSLSYYYFQLFRLNGIKVSCIIHLYTYTTFQ